MELEKLLRADYLDILFDGRNKRYGGYDLRRNYGDRARKAAGIVIAGAVLAVTIPVVAASFSDDSRPPIITECVFNLTPPPVDIPKPPPVTVAEPPPATASVANPELKVVIDEKVLEPPKTVEDLRDKQISFENSEGSDDDDRLSLEGPSGKGLEEVEQPVLPQKPFTSVDQMPIFDGDLGSFLSSHLRYPDQARERGDEGRVGIHFVVNEDGRISDVEVTNKVSAALDAEAARVVKSMPRWKPGKQGGVPVKVYFTLPIIFALD